MRKSVLIILLFFSVAVFSQKAIYNVYAGNHYLGKMDVVLDESDSTMDVEIESYSRFKLLFFEVNLKYTLSCIYKNRELIKSMVVTFVNNHIHSTIETSKQQGDQYLILKDEDEIEYNHAISYSGALLYFKEPNEISRLYSEIDGVTKPLEKMGVHEYQIKEPDNGNINEYFYEDEMLKEARIHHTLMTFRLVKQ